MGDDIVETNAANAKNETVPSAAYRSIGLIGNPFVLRDPMAEPFVELETLSQKNRLLAAIDHEADQRRPKVIWVDKAELPPSYHLMAIGAVEHDIVQDASLNLVHAYVQLGMMRMGRVRAILRVVGERVAFGRMDRTIAAWMDRVLTEPDTTLESYQALGADRLVRFAASFAEDPLAAVHEVFGLPELERHFELSNTADLRQIDIETEVIDETSDGLEIEPDYLEARGVGDNVHPQGQEALPEGEADESAASNEAEEMQAYRDAMFDYAVDYTREHLSPVIARSFRAYRARGVAVAASELTITKAPRKTLGAILTFARCRFRRVVAIFDGFEAWPLADNDLRSKIVGSLSELRSLVGDDLEMVFLIESGTAPELEEQFGHGVRIDWDFSNLDAYFENPGVLVPESVDSWLASAALPGRPQLTKDDAVIARLLEHAEGDLSRFATMAEAAVDDAARRGASRLDEQAEQAGLATIVESE